MVFPEQRNNLLVCSMLVLARSLLLYGSAMQFSILRSPSGMFVSPMSMKMDIKANKQENRKGEEGI